MTIPNSYIQRIRTIVYSLLVVIGIDQITKAFARSLLPNQSISVCGILKFSLVYNPGINLGLGSELPFAVRLFIFIILPLVGIAIGLFYLYRSRFPNAVVAAGSICCACLFSNTLDRLLFRGEVTDFINIAIAPIHRIVFNLADVMDWPAIAYVVYWVLKWAMNKKAEKRESTLVKNTVEIK